MKRSLKIWLVVSIFIVLIALYGVFNTRLSLTYEATNPADKVASVLQVKAAQSKTLLFWLWLIIGYVVANILLIIAVLLKLKRPDTIHKTDNQ
ncbi:hypothetical protein [Microbacter margulisiae]|uniref:Preprotein translocase subunit SecG n=1 Tax=Microbacter margulisiae TaxID=1350067 RepID=A0A7W5H396_9PORP|nr:hypothetical protein [Microbacter margulisiae]MBB3188585.1 preprotein translocase subunit SecG [Microbacter margulisiae]